MKKGSERSIHFSGEVWPPEVQWGSRFSPSCAKKYRRMVGSPHKDPEMSMRVCSQDVKERAGESRQAEWIKSGGEEEEGGRGQRWRSSSEEPAEEMLAWWFFSPLFFSLWKSWVRRGCCRPPLTGQPAIAALLHSHFLPPDLYKAQGLGVFFCIFSSLLCWQVQYETTACTSFCHSHQM